MNHVSFLTRVTARAGDRLVGLRPLLGRQLNSSRDPDSPLLETHPRQRNTFCSISGTYLVDAGGAPPPLSVLADGSYGAGDESMPLMGFMAQLHPNGFTPGDDFEAIGYEPPPPATFHQVSSSCYLP